MTVDPYAALNTGAAESKKAVTANEAGSAERFLKLLVTQMQNQDPLNPMDNAQITSQIAQINTVNGIQQLNTSVQGLNGQFVQMQALQGVSLVGHNVTVPGNLMAYDEDASGAARGVGGFELSGSADRVKVEVLSGAGRVVDTLDLGAQTSGSHSFSWTPQSAALPTPADGYRFRIVATAGTTAVASTALMRDRVEAVSMVGDKLTLEMANSGKLPYSDIRAVN